MSIDTQLSTLLARLIIDVKGERLHLDDLRDQLRSQESKVLYLYEAARATYVALPLQERSKHLVEMAELRATVRHARGASERYESRERAVIDYLARNRKRVVKVAEVQDALHDLGWTAPRGYASATLTKLEKHGICDKVRYARYKANQTHPEIVGRG
ncbi:MAG: hypothetical protein AAGE80_09560 [Pseudomonadota bacterium]